ncbi:ATP-dependent helicase [Phanerochaete sordida]|uniref:DNA helicase n=1 Tax=Phanerochaete sordida TaxID=48140 RepID=A0A9P3GL16_9APHY|nr:ATP-dependent helicase [Phanerochaete sordida]
MQAKQRKAALEHLKFKKSKKQVQASRGGSPAPSTTSLNSPQAVHEVLPAQSRDATVSSRYFNATPPSAGRVLVPNSSPLSSDPPYRENQGVLDSSDDWIPGLNHATVDGRSRSSSTVDPLLSASGFTSSKRPADAFLPHTPNANGLASSMSPPSANGHDVERPRKRQNRGETPPSPDPLDILNAPDSPQVLRPGQRRKPQTITLSTSSDDSLVESSRDIAGPSTSRLVRGERLAAPTPSSSSDLLNTGNFLAFKISYPLESFARIQAAWQLSGADQSKAAALLSDPTWQPPPPPPPRPIAVATVKRAPEAADMGRVKEVEEANKAERARVKEMGKKSMIYAGRGPASPVKAVASIASVATSSSSTPVPPPSTPPTPATPDSPEVGRAQPKRLRKKVIESDSEPDYRDSDDEASEEEEEDANRQTAYEYFNSATAEALQELTGCSAEQAKKIVELRPFATIEDLISKLGQGRKKAGPAGLSPRIFEDSTAIFAGYGTVDSIVTKCEKIAASLRAEIATWTDGEGKGKGREGSTSSRNSPGVSEAEGALSLRSQAILSSTKLDYYISAQPSALSSDVQLKDYQMVGINWLNLLYNRHLSCILADEMGLGKTVQVISFSAHLKDKGNKGPHLIVVPSSTLENWLREFQRFAPSINVRAYYAGKDERPFLRQELWDTQKKKANDDGWEILITTYNLAQGDEKDRKFFRRVEWDTCVFDEGHVLKNFQSQRYQALLKYEANWRLLLTGTPLQNNLQELVSLMNFILPSHFANGLDSLRAVFKTKGDSKVTLLAQERVSRAKKMMTPFVLRRRKDQVLKDLPKKVERIEWCEMTPLQKTIYNDALQRSRKTIFDVEAEKAEAEKEKANGKGAKKKTRGNARAKDKLYLENSTNVLMDLRKAASHPMLFRRRFTDDTLTSIANLLLKEPDYRQRKARFDYVKEDMEVMTDSELQAFCATYKSTRKFLQSEDCYLQAGKVKVLLKLLEGYRAQGRRVLIFSQFTQILDILQRVLEHQKVKFVVLTGSTPVDARQSLVDEFTEDESIQVFLLSTKAGGMGINLTAASVVIMFDQDFNPHNDKQAQDRAYRIGQKRDVDVVKLITKGSIEEDMLELGMTKLALDEAVAGEEGEEKVEREMKTSLMNVVRKKLEVEPVEVDDTKMDVDES